MSTDSVAPSPPRWTSGSGAPVTLDAPGSFTAHAQNLSVLFDTFSVTPSSGAGRRTVHTAAFGAVLRTDEPVQLRMTHFIRGRVEKGAESRVVVTAVLGPTIVVREFPYGTPFDDAILLEEHADFAQMGRQPYTGVITVLIEQRGGDAAILVAIDSIDATFVLAQDEEGAVG